MGPQHPGKGGLRRDAVQVHDLAHQPVVDDLGVQGEDQRAGIETGERPLHPLLGGLDRRQHGPVRGEGLLQRGGNILQQHRRRAHIHQQQRLGAGDLRGDKALPFQQVQGLRRGGGVPDGVAAVLPQGAGERLGHQQLADVLPSAGAVQQIQSGQQLDLARRVLADIVRELRVSQDLIQPAGGDGPQGQEAQDPGASSHIPQEAHAVPGVQLRSAAALCLQGGGQLLPQLPVRPGHMGELQIAGPEDLFVLGLPEIEAVAVDEVLHHRVDEARDVPPQVDVLPDAGGADVLQVGGQLQLDDAAGDAA